MVVRLSKNNKPTRLSRHPSRSFSSPVAWRRRNRVLNLRDVGAHPEGARFWLTAKFSRGFAERVKVKCAYGRVVTESKNTSCAAPSSRLFIFISGSNLPCIHFPLPSGARGFPLTPAASQTLRNFLGSSPPPLRGCFFHLLLPPLSQPTLVHDVRIIYRNQYERRSASDCTFHFAPVRLFRRESRVTVLPEKKYRGKTDQRFEAS